MAPRVLVGLVGESLPKIGATAGARQDLSEGLPRFIRAQQRGLGCGASIYYLNKTNPACLNSGLLVSTRRGNSIQTSCFRIVVAFFNRW